MQAKGLQVDIAALAAVRAPTILHWDFNHFVVFEGFGRRYGRPFAYINDPAQGSRRVSAEDFDGSFTGVVLTLKPGRRFERSGRRPGGVRNLAVRIQSVWAPLVVAFIAGLFAVVVGVARPGFLRAFIDVVLPTSGGSSTTVPLLVTMSVASVALVALVAVQEDHGMRAHVYASTLSSARFMRHLLSLPIPFFQQRNPADVAQRLQTNETVTRVLATAVVAGATSLVVLCAYAGLLWTYDPDLSALGLASVAANGVLVILALRARASATENLRVQSARLAAVSYNGLQLIETMKATGGQDTHFRRWAALHARLLNGRQRIAVPVALMSAATPALAVLGGGLVLMSGALSVVNGTLSIGLLVAFQALIRDVEQPVATLVGLAPQLQDVEADAAKLRDVENADVDRVFVRPRSDDARRLVGAVALHDVTFAYNRLDRPVLRDITFTAAPGRQLALVGGSGSGKSTVSKLLTGLYAPTSGVVTFDEVPLDRIDRAAFAASVAFVDQEIHLFAGTVRDNLRLWDPTIPDEAIIAALHDAELWDVVATRTGGLDASVEQDGRNFSGGQRQRLEIARALARDPVVLVLDEATSALDAETEHAISANLRRRGCTQIVIAHRLSTIRDSDEILVMDAGVIVERGNHFSLMAAGGRYAILASGGS